MYIDLVKDLLKKHFGLPRCSLVIGDTKEPQDRAYYYHLDKERQITALKDLLNMNYLVGGIGKLPELSQTIPDKDDDCTDIDKGGVLSPHVQ